MSFFFQLHQDEEHHDYEAGGHYNDERWAWMQTEVQRISTEQQRQGVEITGLRNDVLRGNRINEENNQMLRIMMQHLHLQGIPCTSLYRSVYVLAFCMCILK